MADETMDVDGVLEETNNQPGVKAEYAAKTEYLSKPEYASPPPPLKDKDTFREIHVKVHVRRPDKDSWSYLGKGVVTQEMSGHSSRVVVRNLSTGKVMTQFNESSDLQAEKRGNFVVIGCIDGPRVVSWSLNAMNNSDTLRLLASIELACYRCKQALQDPRSHGKARRKIERLIKDDRRKRHRRRKDQEAMIDAFAKQTINGGTVRREPSPPEAIGGSAVSLEAPQLNGFPQAAMS